MIDCPSLLAPLLLIPITLLLVFLGCGLSEGGLGFLNWTLSDGNSTVSADNSEISTTSPTDTVTVAVSTNTTSSGPVNIEQSMDGSFNPSTTSTLLSISIGTSGGNGSSNFTVTQGMASFYLRANNGYFTAGPIHVKIPSAPTPPPPSGWNWDGTQCVPSTAGTGTYPTLAACQAAHPQPPPPPTPITRIQFARGAASSGLTIPVSIAAPINGNTLIAVMGVYSNNNLTVSGITQAGAIWVRDVSKQTGNGNGDVEIWRASNVQNAGTAIKVTLMGSGTLIEAIAEVCEYSGLINANPFDQSGTNTGVSGTPTIGTMATTAQPKELWIAGITHLGNDTQSAPKPPFTFTDSSDGVATNNMSLGYLEYIASSIGTPSTGVTVSSNFFAASIATYRGN